MKPTILTGKDNLFLNIEDRRTGRIYIRGAQVKDRYTILESFWNEAQEHGHTNVYDRFYSREEGRIVVDERAKAIVVSNTNHKLFNEETIRELLTQYVKEKLPGYTLKISEDEK